MFPGIPGVQIDEAVLCKQGCENLPVDEVALNIGVINYAVVWAIGVPVQEYTIKGEQVYEKHSFDSRPY